MTKEELRRYRHIVKRIEQLKSEREELIGLVKPPDGLPRGSGKSDPTASAGAKLADLAAQIDDAIAELSAERSRIMAVLSQLGDVEYDVMYQRYIQGKTWQQIADDLHYNLRWVYRLHGFALAKLRPL